MPLEQRTIGGIPRFARPSNCERKLAHSLEDEASRRTGYLLYLVVIHVAQRGERGWRNRRFWTLA